MEDVAVPGEQLTRLLVPNVQQQGPHIRVKGYVKSGQSIYIYIYIYIVKSVNNRGSRFLNIKKAFIDILSSFFCI